MKTFRLILGLLPLLIIPLASGQQVKSKQPQTPVETSVCRIVDDPSLYNNKLVKVRGFVRASFEYSVLLDTGCPDEGIWFAFADGSGPPGLVATVTGKGALGNRDSNGRVMLPLPAQLIRDSNFEKLERYWAISAKGEACADDPPPTSPPDCTTYRVTALSLAASTEFPKKFTPHM
jgi:hypothetical protein